MLAAIHDFFNHPGLRATFLKARVPIGLAVMVLVLWLAQPRCFWVGLTVSMFGQLIQLWSFASLNKNQFGSSTGMRFELTPVLCCIG